MTNPKPKIMPQVVIEAISFTPGREPVIIQYSACNTKVGPLASSQLHHATQEKLRARCARGVLEWGDAEAIAELSEHLTECGISAEVLASVDLATKAGSL